MLSLRKVFIRQTSESESDTNELVMELINISKELEFATHMSAVS